MVDKSQPEIRVGWSVYIVECADGSYYTGVSTDVQRRVHEHNHSARAAKYTRVRRPVKLIWWEDHVDRASACRREWAIKQMSRTQKQALLSLQAHALNGFS